MFHNILKDQGVENCLKSAWALGYKKDPIKGDFKKMLLDSGGYTARVKGIDIDVNSYIAYINHYGIELAFNLDTADPAKTAENLKLLRAQTKAKIIDIYHYSDYRDPALRESVLERCMTGDDHAYMAVGGVAGVNTTKDVLVGFLDYVFSRTRDQVKVHGLGMTTKALLWRYPYYSVDSTTWLTSARYGRSEAIKDTRVQQVRSRSIPYKKRMVVDIQHYMQVERDTTILWEKRGVKWGEI